VAELDTFTKTIDTPDSINQDVQNYRDDLVGEENLEVQDEFSSIADNLGLKQEVLDDPTATVEPVVSEQQEPKVDDPKKDPLAKEPKETLAKKVAESPAVAITSPIDKTLDTVEKSKDFPRLPLGADVYLGFMTSGKSALHGAIKGLNESLRLIDQVATPINELLGLPQTEEKFFIPNVDAPYPTGFGNLIETMSQFATGFGFVGRMLKGLGVAQATTKAGIAAQTILKGSAADVVAFNEQQERLSNLVESIPALRNPVTDYLAADKDDSFLEGKIKQAVEGAFLGAGAEVIAKGFVEGIKILKKFKAPQAKAVLSPEDIARAEQEVIKNSTEILGNIDDKRLIYKVSKSVQDVEGLSDKEIKKLTKKGLLPTKEEKEIVVNLSHIETPEDIRAVMKSFVADNKLRNVDARRGVRTFQKTLEAAGDINGFKELMDRRVGQAFNAEQIAAAQQWYYYITEKLVEASKKVALPGHSEIDVFSLRKIMSIHDATQAEISGIKAESGRSFGAWRIPANADGVDVKGITELLNQYGGTKDTIELAKKISAFGSRLTTSQFNKITQKGAYAANRDAFIEVWTLGLLTSPPTHIRNIASSTLTGLAEIPKRTLQSFIPNSGVEIGEVVYYANGMVRSLRDAFANGAKAFRTGEVGFGTGKLELPRKRASGEIRKRLKQSKLDLSLSGGVFEQKDFSSGALLFLKKSGNTAITPYAYGMDYYGKAMSYAGKGLAAGDEFARTVLARAQISALSARDGIGQGLKGKELDRFVNNATNNVDPKTMDLAREFAEYNIFINKLGEAGQAGQKLISKVPLLKLAMPFFRTPANLLKWKFQHTPLAVLSKNVRADIAAGGFKRSEALAKIGLGTTIMQIATDQALRGNITGSGTTNPGLRRHEQSLGIKPNSIKIGDTYVGYGGLDPIAGLISFSADMALILTNYESYDIDSQDEVDKLSTALTLLIANQVVGQGFLSGISDLFEAVSDEQKGERFLRNVLSGFIPTGLGTVARGLDPESRMVVDLMDAIKSKIPGWSKSVPRRRNVWGEVISTSYPTGNGIMDDTGRFFNATLNPVYLSKARDSPSDQWMIENGSPISMPLKSLTLDGVKIDLKDFDEHAEMYSRFVELRGQEIKLFQYDDMNMKDYIDKLVSNVGSDSERFFDVYETFDEQKSFLDKVVRDYTDAAKTQFIEEFKVLQYSIRLGKEQEKRIAANPIVQKIMSGG